MNEQPPEDLAGYQCIESGTIEEGDILVSIYNRFKAWATLSFIGAPIESESQFDIYRKIPCPKAGDHDKAWMRARDEEKLKGMPWCGDKPKAKTDDGDKPPLSNLPWKALREVAQVQAYGHKKYGSFHNFKLGMEVDRNLSCAIRHIADFMDGIDLDKESGRHHLAHAACRILFALENIKDETAKDTRYKKL